MIAALAGRHARQHARLLAALAIGAAALEVVLGVVVARFDQGAGLREIALKFIPEHLHDALAPQLALLSFDGAVAFGFQHPVVFVAALGFVFAVATLPAAERESGFLELVLARPVERTRYLAGIVVPLLGGAAVLGLAPWGGALIAKGITGHGTLSAARFGLGALGLALLLAAIGGIVLALAAGARRRGPVVARGVGLLLAAYLVESIGDLWAPLRALRWASPFHWFTPIVDVTSGRFPVAHAAVLLGVFAGGVAIAAWRFERADV